MNKKISIVGIGMDGAETLTKKGEAAIKSADVIIGAERMVKLFEGLHKPFFTSYISADIADFIRSCTYEKIAVLMSGDCGFYSGTQNLLPLLNGYETDIICGISSPVYFCSRLKIPWQDIHFVSLHGADNSIIRHVCSNENTFFLLGGKNTPDSVCRTLCEYGLGNVMVHIGEDLACESERISSGRAADFVGTEAGGLCVMIVENPDCEKNIRSCIPDDEFIRGGVPMTKSEVRCVCVAKLATASDSVCWDIGSGSGSVSVEMAMRCPDGKIYAVEKNPEAVTLTDKNRHKFGCDNIEIICADAVNAADDLPAPDCVFIGGSSGQLEKIIGAAYGKNRSAKIVLTAVSLETLSSSLSVFEKHGAYAEISQLAVTRTRKIVAHTMLSAENPVFIVRGIVK